VRGKAHFLRPGDSRDSGAAQERIEFEKPGLRRPYSSFGFGVLLHSRRDCRRDRATREKQSPCRSGKRMDEGLMRLKSYFETGKPARDAAGAKEIPHGQIARPPEMAKPQG
jgi:hypothetical protein